MMPCMLYEIKWEWNFAILSVKWNMNWLVGGALAWDDNAWDDMWNIVDKRISWETLDDGVVSIYLDVGDV